MEERAENAERSFILFFQNRFARVHRCYSTGENFLASLGPVVLISSSLPASAHRTKERRTFPTNRGRRDLRDREGDGGKISVHTGEQGYLRGNQRNEEEDEGGSGKNKKERGRTIRQRTSPLFALASSWLSPVGGGSGEGASVRSRVVMVKSGGR